jgi:hypothetical protein
MNFLRSLFSSLAALCVLSGTPQVQAATLTVDNNPNAVAMYTDFGTAYAAAADGDTILLASSPTNYGAFDIYKRLNIVGPGYFLGTNAIPGLSVNAASIHLDLRRDPLVGNASGSKLTGVTLTFYPNYSAVATGVTGVVVDRCKADALDVHTPVVIRRSYLLTLNLSSGSAGSLVSNCIIDALAISDGLISCSHCVFTRFFSGQDTSTVSDSIFTTTTASNIVPDGSVFNRCLSIGGAYLPVGNGNINGPLIIANVLLNTGSEDGKYRLKTGSVAIGAGTGGSDIGAFSGSTPYILGGVPGRPRLTRLVVPPTATNTSGLTFEVDARAFAE